MSAAAPVEVAELLGAAQANLEALVAISTPSGDNEAAERAFRLCAARLPGDARVERVPCSSPGHARDFLVRISGRGSGRILLLGHIDTVVAHPNHVPLRREGDVWRGSGAVDMKGGVALALELARWLAARRESFAEVAILLVVDEEWREQPFAHVGRFDGFDACLCFEAGERAPDGAEGVVVQRKAAGTLRVGARGRAAHAGSNPDAGVNALLSVARAARAAAALHDPHGPASLSVVPSRIRAGEAINVVPAHGELMIDVRARSDHSFGQVAAELRRSADGEQVKVDLIRNWPGMDTRTATEDVLRRAGARLGRQIVGLGRGGASDASHLASAIPLTIDGLGPRGGNAHSPEEYVCAASLQERIELAIAVCETLLERP